VKQESAKALGDGAATLAASTGVGSYLGWFDFINQNAAGIGVIISFISLCVAVTFYVMTYNKPDNSDKNLERIKLLEDQLKGISDRKQLD